MCMISWMIRPPCEITDQLAVGTQNYFSTLFYMPYTNIKTSAQNAPKCTIPRQKIKKNFWPLPRPLRPPLGRGIPPPRTPPSSIGAFGTTIIAPSALGVPVPFHLRLEHWVATAFFYMFKGYLYPFFTMARVAVHLFQMPKIKPVWDCKSLRLTNRYFKWCHHMLPPSRASLQVVLRPRGHNRLWCPKSDLWFDKTFFSSPLSIHGEECIMWS